MRSHHFLLLVGALLIGISTLGIISFAMVGHLGDSHVTTPSRPSPASTPVVHSVTFAAMGDMLAHEPVDISARTASGYDFKPYFVDVEPLFRSADVTFCNPETLAAGSPYTITGYPQFNAPTEFAQDLKDIGCDIFNYATNHVADKGQAALDASLANWDKVAPLAITGANRSQAEQDTVKYFTVHDIRCAFLAFADFSNMALPHPYSVNLYHDTALVERLMREARAHADVVIVSMHWGTEDSTAVNEDQREASQRVADLGADVIIGTGPHVLQPVVELMRHDGGHTLVWYSIGNMLSAQMWVNELTGGVAQWTVTKTDDTIRVSDIEFDATFMSYAYTVTSDGGKMVTKGTFQLKPLAQAIDGTAKWGTTVAERTAFVRETLGDAVRLRVGP